MAQEKRYILLIHDLRKTSTSSLYIIYRVRIFAYWQIPRAHASRVRKPLKIPYRLEALFDLIDNKY